MNFYLQIFSLVAIRFARCMHFRLASSIPDFHDVCLNASASHNIMPLEVARTRRVPWPTFARCARALSWFPSANVIVDISGVAHDYNIVHCGARLGQSDYMPRIEDCICTVLSHIQVLSNIPIVFSSKYVRVREILTRRRVTFSSRDPFFVRMCINIEVRELCTSKRDIKTLK